MEFKFSEEEFRKRIRQNMEQAEKERDVLYESVRGTFEDIFKTLEERRNGTSSLKFQTIEEDSETTE